MGMTCDDKSSQVISSYTSFVVVFLSRSHMTILYFGRVQPTSFCRDCWVEVLSRKGWTIMGQTILPGQIKMQPMPMESKTNAQQD